MMKNKFIACAVVLSSLFSAASFAHEGHDHDNEESVEVTQAAEASPAAESSDTTKSHDCSGAVSADENAEANEEADAE